MSYAHWQGLESPDHRVMDTHSVIHSELVVRERWQRFLQNRSQHRLRGRRSEAKMRTRTPAKVTHPRPVDVEAVRVGQCPLVAIGRAVKEDQAGLRRYRRARDGH